MVYYLVYDRMYRDYSRFDTLDKAREYVKNAACYDSKITDFIIIKCEDVEQ